MVQEQMQLHVFMLLSYFSETVICTVSLSALSCILEVKRMSFRQFVFVSILLDFGYIAKIYANIFATKVLLDRKIYSK